MSTELALALGVLLLAANAFFVGAEFAIISARRSAIEPLAEAGNRRAVVVLWAMEHVSLMLACAQLGITVCSTSLGVVAEPAIAHLIEVPLEHLGVPGSWTHPIAFVVALVIVVFLHVVLGEMVPKNLAVAGPDRAVMWFGPPLVWVARAVRPVIVVLNTVANWFLRLFGVEPRDEVASAFTAEEVQSIVERSQEEGLLDDEHGLLAGALEFSDRDAGDVMVPVGRWVAVPEDVTPADYERLVARTGYSRFPVVRQPEGSGAAGERPVGDADGVLVQGDPVGYLHLKDILYAGDDERDLPVPSWRVRSLAQVAPEDSVEATLAAMQASGVHLARVERDGQVLGLVFLEDIIEELVGEVRDAMQRGTVR